METSRQPPSDDGWECKRCGNCCRTIVLPVTAVKDNIISGLFEAHGLPLNQTFKITLFHECRHLVTYKDGKTYCDIYENRPNICRTFTCKGKGSDYHLEIERMQYA